LSKFECENENDEKMYLLGQAQKSDEFLAKFLLLKDNMSKNLRNLQIEFKNKRNMLPEFTA